MNTVSKTFTGLAAVMAAVAAGLGPAAAEQAPTYYYGQHMWEGGWWFFGPFSMLLFLAVLVGLIVVLVRWLSGGSEARTGSSPSALDILRERFARGEIDKAEFDERRKVLGA